MGLLVPMGWIEKYQMRSEQQLRQQEISGVKSKQEEEEATTGVDEQTNEPTQESEPITQRTYKQTR